MLVYRRYFRVTEGPLLDAVKEADEINRKAHKEYIKILNEIGADHRYYQTDGKLTGIIFDKNPDSGIFKKAMFGYGWYPKKNCKIGKELAKRIESIKTKNIQDCLALVGLHNSPTIFANGMGYCSTLIVIPEDSPVIYVSVPWYDEDPEKIKQYKKDNQAGKRSSAQLDHISKWTPTNSMKEIKEWEVTRHIEEWNEKLKTA